MRKGVKVLLVGLMVILLVTLSALSCGQAPATPTAPATATASPAAPTTTPPPKAIKLKLSEYSPAGPGRANVVKWWADEVQKRTNGRVKIEIYWAASLFSGTETLAGTQGGACDIGDIAPTYYVSQLPLGQMTTYWFFFEDAWICSQAWWDFMIKYPPALKENQNWNLQPTCVLMCASQQITFAKGVTPARTVAGLKNLRVRAAGLGTPIISAAGAVAVSVTATDVYDAMMKKVIDSITWHLDAIYRYKIYEVADYSVLWDMGFMPGNYLCMNLDTWNQLPKDVQQVVLDLGDKGDNSMANYIEWRDSEKDMRATMQKAGLKYADPEPGERAKMEALAGPVLDKWVKDQDAKGIKMTEARDALRKIYAEDKAREPSLK